MNVSDCSCDAALCPNPRRHTVAGGVDGEAFTSPLDVLFPILNGLVLELL